MRTFIGTREKDPLKVEDKILIIGGAIANFTDVAKTFTGIIQAFEEYADKMKDTGVRIYVRNEVDQTMKKV